MIVIIIIIITSVVIIIVIIIVITVMVIVIIIVIVIISPTLYLRRLVSYWVCGLAEGEAQYSLLRFPWSSHTSPSSWRLVVEHITKAYWLLVSVQSAGMS